MIKVYGNTRQILGTGLCFRHLNHKLSFNFVFKVTEHKSDQNSKTFLILTIFADDAVFASMYVLE